MNRHVKQAVLYVGALTFVLFNWGIWYSHLPFRFQVFASILSVFVMGFVFLITGSFDDRPIPSGRFKSRR